MGNREFDLIQNVLGSRRPERLAMLRDLDAMSRRDLLRRGGRLATGAGAASLLFRNGFPLAPASAQGTPEAVKLPQFGEIPADLKGSGEVRVISWGGALQEAQREAYFKPFEELCGIKVVEGEGPDISKVKAMVDSGNVEYDVVEVDRSDIMNLEKQGDYWNEIDYSIFDTANIDKSHLYKYSVDMLPYGTVIGYRNDVFSEGPTGQKDFWDLTKFPGPRTTESGTGGVSPFLEAALIADGVAMDELYPLDIDRAFNSLSKIKSDVAKFWEAGAQPAQLLNDKEVVMGHAWNGRIYAVQVTGAPVTTVWNEGMLATDVWGSPKGSNAENATKFMAFITLPVSQARMSMLITYGFVNDAAAKLIPPDRLAQLPTAPQYKDQMFTRNIDWWVANLQAVTDRWNEWILE
ncbi:MAG TPA: ABC transporter substrate-binding protein [Thermomicrobiales bacterium]|nr:ABC transporter substrate-binding protein [Thermomicrobiales bacterium]